MSETHWFPVQKLWEDSDFILSRETPPGGYNTKNLSFVQVASGEYGIPANHWRQTITLGNATTTNYFDGRWRKLLTYTADTSNPSATQRLVSYTACGHTCRVSSMTTSQHPKATCIAPYTRRSSVLQARALKY